jgi:hypothetical protein
MSIDNYSNRYGALKDQLLPVTEWSGVVEWNKPCESMSDRFL